MGWKTVRDITGWMLATSVGISISWLGVRAVLDAAVPDRFLALPAAEQGPPVVPSTTAITSPTRSAAARTPRATPSQAGRSASPTASASVPASASALPATVDGWTPLGDGQYLRSFHLAGGDAVVAAGQGSVRLVSATPRPGYTMTILSSGPARVVVDFATTLRISTLDATWGDTGPAATVTELP
jgi:hypothetical protein